MSYLERSFTSFVTHRLCFGVIFAIAATAPNLARAQAGLHSTGPLASVMQSLVDNHVIAGAVALVASKDKVVDVEVVGYSDLAAQTPMRTSDEFWIASMSKAMTGSALMMLVDEGKVKLDDPVEKYLPEFRGQKVRAVKPASLHDPGEYQGELVAQSHPFTVREMLCHTAGLQFRSTAIERRGALDQHPLAEAVQAYAAEPLLYQPGTDYSYANEDFNVAGRIVEVVSKVPYETFMQKRLFDPLGMINTTFWPNQEQIARLAKTYKSKAGNLVEAPLDQLTLPLDDRKHRYPMPAGGLFSDAHDSMCFMQMLLNNGVFQGKKILSEASVREMTTVQNDDLENTPYGIGLNIAKNKYGHSGAYKTSMQAFPNTGTVLIFLVQLSGDFSRKSISQLEPIAEKLVTSAETK